LLPVKEDRDRGERKNEVGKRDQGLTIIYLFLMSADSTVGKEGRGVVRRGPGLELAERNCGLRAKKDPDPGRKQYAG